MNTALACALLAVIALSEVSLAAPLSDSDVLSTLTNMQEQLNALRKQYENKPQSRDEFAPFQAAPQKRLVAWQPMKRSGADGADREAVFRAIEARLMEVLAAGERLGVSPEEVLEHIRSRNSQRVL